MKIPKGVKRRTPRLPQFENGNKILLSRMLNKPESKQGECFWERRIKKRVDISIARGELAREKCHTRLVVLIGEKSSKGRIKRARTEARNPRGAPLAKTGKRLR